MMLIIAFLYIKKQTIRVMKMLKVGIIGTGSFSSKHVKSYQTFKEEVRIVALCNRHTEKADLLAKEYNLDVTVYGDYKEMLEKEELDLVSICTPPFVHAEIAIEALNSGSHVLVEKPMAASLEECDRMLRAAEDNHKVLSVVSQNRFTDPIMKLKTLLDEKVAGKILHAQMDSFWWRGNSYYDLWWRGTWEKESGGCTINHAVHHLDIFKWLNGMPDEITAVMSNLAHDKSEVEDISIAIGKYNNGSLATLTSSIIHHGQEKNLVFQGEKARISAPFKVMASRARADGFPEEDTETMNEIQARYDRLEDLPYEGLTGQIDNVIQHIINDAELVIDGRQGRETLELITAIYTAAHLGHAVTLPLDQSNPFYTKEKILKNATRFNAKTILDGQS